ncbi:MAG: DNA replication and repair protein RecF [Eubacteriales bacterium SKADARSKE-1]|nr:DNA replication and repair protein RecF [Eubacteriales bacterium SKADARSKE-1]
MKVSELKLENYRNLKNNSFLPCDGVNVIYGNNAQGKTNLLEAIWLFTGGKSFRGTRDLDLITFKEKKSNLFMKLFSENRNQTLKITLEGKSRLVSVNDVAKKQASELIGNFCAVAFSPIHLALIKDGPAARRKFLDTAICQIQPLCAKTIFKYIHTLNQRNHLLKEIKNKKNLYDTLEIWDEKLATFAADLVSKRIKYVELMKELSKESYENISGKNEVLDIKYETNCYIKSKSEPIDLISQIKEKLRKAHKEDIAIGFTTIGPHRDDLNILIDGKSAKMFSSQGQQRSAVLAMKLSEATILNKICKKNPVILLDDVMSEIDSYRQDYVLNSFSNEQIFITCCEPTTLKKLKNGALFTIENGTIN